MEREFDPSRIPEDPDDAKPRTMELTRGDLDVGIVAFDVEPMLRFYGEVLALPSKGSPLALAGFGKIHRFLVGSNLLKVVEPDQPPSSTPRTGVPEAVAGIRYVTVHVRDLVAVLERVTASGHAIVTGPAEPAPGIRFAYIADPDGNYVELVEGP